MRVEFRSYYEPTLDQIKLEKHIDNKPSEVEFYNDVSKAKDAALMAALPDEALKALYDSVVDEIFRRGGGSFNPHTVSDTKI